MSNIKYNRNYFNLSKEHAVDTSNSMKKVLDNAATVKRDSSSGEYNLNSTISEIEELCLKGDNLVNTFNNWQELMERDQFEWLYPAFQNLSIERQAVIAEALRYVGKTNSDIDWVDGIWCAKFAGGIINGATSTNIINSPNSVAKILGLSGNPNGIAFSNNANSRYILSQAYTNKYLKYNGNLAGWQSAINSFNNKNPGRNIKGSDWVDPSYSPQSGDLIFFQNEGNFNENTYLTNGFPGSTTSMSHVGIVLGVREKNGVKYVDTIEGNYEDKVAVRSYQLDSSYIVGYGDINYENVVDPKKIDTQKISNVNLTTVNLNKEPSEIVPPVVHSEVQKVSDTTNNNSNVKNISISDNNKNTNQKDNTKSQHSESKNTKERDNTESHHSNEVHSQPAKNIFPNNQFTVALPELNSGTLEFMEIDTNHVKYEISGVSDESYNNYLNSLRQAGYVLSTDGTSWMKGNYNLSVQRDSNSMTVSVYNNSNI